MPLSPVTNTVLRLAAARRANSKASRTRGLSATTSSSEYRVRSSARRYRFSRASRVTSSARFTSARSSSLSKGFWT